MSKEQPNYHEFSELTNFQLEILHQAHTLKKLMKNMFENVFLVIYSWKQIGDKVFCIQQWTDFAQQMLLSFTFYFINQCPKLIKDLCWSFVGDSIKSDGRLGKE